MVKEEYRFRHPNENDLEAICSLLQDVSIYAPSKDELNASFPAFNDQENSFPIVAVGSANEVIGFAHMVLFMRIRGGLSAHIEDVVIDSAYRGQGIGRDMVASLKRVAASRGAHKITLVALEGKIPFYAKCGFEASGVSLTSKLR